MPSTSLLLLLGSCSLTPGLPSPFCLEDGGGSGNPKFEHLLLRPLRQPDQTFSDHRFRSPFWELLLTWASEEALQLRLAMMETAAVKFGVLTSVEAIGFAVDSG